MSAASISPETSISLKLLSGIGVSLTPAGSLRPTLFFSSARLTPACTHSMKKVQAVLMDQEPAESRLREFAPIRAGPRGDLPNQKVSAPGHRGEHRSMNVARSAWGKRGWPSKTGRLARSGRHIWQRKFPRRQTPVGKKSEEDFFDRQAKTRQVDAFHFHASVDEIRDMIVFTDGEVRGSLVTLWTPVSLAFEILEWGTNQYPTSPRLRLYYGGLQVEPAPPGRGTCAAR